MHAVNVYRGVEVLFHSFLTRCMLMIRCTSLLLYPRSKLQRFPLSRRESQELVWHLWRREKLLGPAGNRTTISRLSSQKPSDYRNSVLVFITRCEGCVVVQHPNAICIGIQPASSVEDVGFNFWGGGQCYEEYKKLIFDRGVSDFLQFKLILYRGADKSLARPTFRCILFYGENILFDASLVLYIQYSYSSNYDYKWDI